jgi:tellurite resistance protein
VGRTAEARELGLNALEAPELTTDAFAMNMGKLRRAPLSSRRAILLGAAIVALSDGELNDPETTVLDAIASGLGFRAPELEAMLMLGRAQRRSRKTASQHAA